MKNLWNRIKNIFKKKEENAFQVSQEWKNFYAVEADYIYIQGPRRIGKTANLLNHMLENEETDNIWVTDAIFKHEYVLDLLENYFKLDLKFTHRYEVSFTYRGKDKKLRFYALSNPKDFRGIYAKGVYIDTSHLNKKTMNVIRELVAVLPKVVIADESERKSLYDKEVASFITKTMDVMLFIK